MNQGSRLQQQLQRSPRPRDRQQAARALGALGDPQAVGILLTGLKDPNVSVRMAVVEALGRHGTDERASKAVAAAFRDPEPAVRAAVAEALGKIGDQQAVATLLAARDDDNQAVRTEATSALASLGSGAVEPLIDTLRHPSSSVRASAAKMLGQLHDRRALKPLEAALGDPDRLVRVLATEALVELGHMPPTEALLEAAEHHPSPFVQWQLRKTTRPSSPVASAPPRTVSVPPAATPPARSGRANRWIPKLVVTGLVGALVAAIVLAPSPPEPTGAAGPQPSNSVIPVAQTTTTTTTPTKTTKPATTKPPATRPPTTTRPDGSNPACEFNLAEAIVEEYINAVFEGRGDSSGDSINGKVRNKTRRTLYLRVRSGIRLDNRDSHAQDMLVQGLSPGDSSYPRLGCLELSPGALVTFTLRAYCEDFTLANPGIEDRLTIAGRARGELGRLFATLGELPDEGISGSTSIEAAQVAVWVLTNNVTRSQLAASFPVAEPDIRAARALLRRARISVSNRRLFK
jgi:HEAT repeats/PBS lyase HEAT-like repeat